MSPKMSARSGLAGKKSSRPHLVPPQAIFCVGRKNRTNAEMLPIFLGGPMGYCRFVIPWAIQLIRERDSCVSSMHFGHAKLVNYLAS